MSDATFTIRLKCASCGAWVTADKVNADELNDIMARFILSTCESGHIKPPRNGRETKTWRAQRDRAVMRTVK